MALKMVLIIMWGGPHFLLRHPVLQQSQPAWDRFGVMDPAGAAGRPCNYSSDSTPCDGVTRSHVFCKRSPLARNLQQ